MTGSSTRVVWGVYIALTAVGLLGPLAIGFLAATDPGPLWVAGVALALTLLLGLAVCASYAPIPIQLADGRRATAGAALHAAAMFAVCTTVLGAAVLCPWTQLLTFGMGFWWAIGLLLPTAFETGVFLWAGSGPITEPPQQPTTYSLWD